MCGSAGGRPDVGEASGRPGSHALWQQQQLLALLCTSKINAKIVVMDSLFVCKKSTHNLSQRSQPRRHTPTCYVPMCANPLFATCNDRASKHRCDSQVDEPATQHRRSECAHGLLPTFGCDEHDTRIRIVQKSSADTVQSNIRWALQIGRIASMLSIKNPALLSSQSK
jgi:hypothetical protein